MAIGTIKWNNQDMATKELVPAMLTDIGIAIGNELGKAAWEATKQYSIERINSWQEAFTTPLTMGELIEAAGTFYDGFVAGYLSRGKAL